jgi:hypothetical protein
MNTRGSRSNRFAIALALLAAALIQGCSGERDGNLLGPTMRDNGAVSVGVAPPAIIPGQTGVSQMIDGSLGGQVSNGRFTLLVPAGAFPGTRIITIATSAVDELQCELYPEGLQFAVPATLAIDLTGTGLDEDPAATVLWYDPNTANWVDMNGALDVHSVRAALPHFSIYRGHRAGW